MRLLFVEDEPDLREVLKKQLQGSGYSVDACGDGLEALDYLQLTAYDAVILDIMLPGVDGLSVLKKMRTAGDKTPVLLLTARGSVEDRVAGLDLGADDYLVKPFDSTVMLWIWFSAMLSFELLTHQSSMSMAVTGLAPRMEARMARIEVPHPISRTDFPFRSASNSSLIIELVVS